MTAVSSAVVTSTFAGGAVIFTTTFYPAHDVSNALCSATLFFTPDWAVVDSTQGQDTHFSSQIRVSQTNLNSRIKTRQAPVRLPQQQSRISAGQNLYALISRFQVLAIRTPKKGCSTPVTGPAGWPPASTPIGVATLALPTLLLRWTPSPLFPERRKARKLLPAAGF